MMKARILERTLNGLANRLHLFNRHLNYYIYERQIKQSEYAKFKTIPTWTKQIELDTLYNLSATLPRGAFALEIGSHLGASTCYLAAGLERAGGHLFCVDTWKNETMREGERDTYAEFLENTQSLRQHITPIRKKSSELNDRDIRLPLHLVFIDGDHSYAGVKSDFDLISPWVAEDGIIAFHDSNVKHYQGVSQVIGEALLTGQWKVSGVIHSLLWLNPMG